MDPILDNFLDAYLASRDYSTFTLQNSSTTGWSLAPVRTHSTVRLGIKTVCVSTDTNLPLLKVGMGVVSTGLF